MCDKPPSDRDLYDLPLLKRVKIFAVAMLLIYPIVPLQNAYLSYAAGEGFQTIDSWDLPWWMFLIVFPVLGLIVFRSWVRDMQQLRQDKAHHLDMLAKILGLGFILAFVLTN